MTDTNLKELPGLIVSFFIKVVLLSIEFTTKSTSWISLSLNVLTHYLHKCIFSPLCLVKCNDGLQKAAVTAKSEISDWFTTGEAYRADRVVFKCLSKLITRLLRLVIGVKIARQFFDQWEAKPKPPVPCAHDFSRALIKWLQFWLVYRAVCSCCERSE